ncbi:hypothetical protein [Glycomyces terrestris]|uniref:Uncharacterized protein n=1 Tax=Glycomyces terrestris TaxID=2493553 RepID=A0A426V1L6_9ACTN|nr:hypothetical protein [Glycomyces terrestris]RRS00727.1 hypothetical protein EIW28_09300 [Glycomyces terrestris]
MSGNEIANQVTSDPELDARLRRKHSEGAGSRELGEYAASLGLEAPVTAPSGSVPSVVFEFPPGSATGVLVWDVPEPGEEEDEEEEWSDADNPWVGVVEVVEAPQSTPKDPRSDPADGDQ